MHVSDTFVFAAPPPIFPHGEQQQDGCQLERSYRWLSIVCHALLVIALGCSSGGSSPGGSTQNESDGGISDGGASGGTGGRGGVGNGGGEGGAPDRKPPSGQRVITGGGF